MTRETDLHILGSTELTQGERQTDVCRLAEGTLLHLPPKATQQNESLLLGIESHEPTSTFQVLRFSGTLDELRDLYYKENWIDFDANRMLFEVAVQHPVGTILERRGMDFFVRHQL